jgi:hypothetical protein
MIKVHHVWRIRFTTINAWNELVLQYLLVSSVLKCFDSHSFTFFGSHGCTWRGSNPRMTGCKPVAFPLGDTYMVPVEGIEPT